MASAGEEPVVTSDLLRIRTVRSIDVAPDGTQAVFFPRVEISAQVREEAFAPPN